MNDYKELVENVRICASGDCCGCTLHGNKINCQEVLLESAANAIEQLMNDYEILAKMYAKVSEDLCVRTKERDAIEKRCHNCKNSFLFNWEWRGVKEDNR